MHIHLCSSGFLKREMLVEETLASSWIDLNFSIGLHVARAVSLQDLLENWEIGTRRSMPEVTRAVNSSLSPIAVNKHRT